MHSNSSWDEIIAESSARPIPLTGDRFRSWIGRQGVFVSSLMDAEMTPYRNAVRTYLRGNGSAPLMWEEITPQDKSARLAYLDGVDQANIFLLLLGRSYGVADASGASPTHQEEMRAAERNIPRLLFTMSGIDSRERDAKLNRWLGSLYNELSAATFDTPEMLVASVDAKLRELAAQSDRTWIKLGSLVFPGKVKANFNPGGGGEFTIVARVSTGSVRHALLSLGNSFSRVRAEHLTWSDRSYPVQVVSVSSESEFTAEDAVEINCRTQQNWHGGVGSTVAMMGGAESKQQWMRLAFFGEQQESDAQRRNYGFERVFSSPDAKTLPEVLKATGATGWLAEGLVRLYLVEEVAQRYGGQFQYLDISSPTAKGVRVKGSFSMNSEPDTKVEGLVPLKPLPI
jgi:hypothetical protein